MKLGTWNVRSFYRAGSLKAIATELARYKLDVVGMQEVRFDEECLGFLDQRKRAKMQWVQDPCQGNVDNLNSVR